MISRKPRWFPKFIEAEIPDQTGKVVVITGTTTGTGQVAAKVSLSKGATVLMLNRNEEKARENMKSFFAEHPETEERAHFFLCDLQSFESVETCAKAIIEQFEESGLDVLCNNAGVMALADVATIDGYDVQMQTNHLSHFLLTRLLFPLLSKRAEAVGDARVVNHSSGLRLFPPFPLDVNYLGPNGGKLGGNESNVFTGGRFRRYHQSKLANSVFTVEMHNRLTAANSKVSTYCAQPGIAQTELLGNTVNDGGNFDLSLIKYAQTMEDGAMGILKGMFVKDLVKGALYGPVLLIGPAYRDFHGPFTTAAAGKMLWAESEKACGEFKI